MGKIVGSDMDTLMLDRTTPIDELFSFIGAERVTASWEAGRVILTPATSEDIDKEDDFDRELLADVNTILTTETFIPFDKALTKLGLTCADLSN